jgi:hypothetical protein
VPDGDQILAGQLGQRTPADPGADSLQCVQPGSGRQLVAWSEGPRGDRFAQGRADLLPSSISGSWVYGDDENVTVLGERGTSAGQVAALRQARVELAQEGSADLPDPFVTENRTDGAANKSLVGRARGDRQLLYVTSPDLDHDGRLGAQIALIARFIQRGIAGGTGNALGTGSR